MKNIMNHADYEYRPTEKLNFLNGSNGSGKSAVLTSIVFGLGTSLTVISNSLRTTDERLKL